MNKRENGGEREKPEKEGGGMEEGARDKPIGSQIDAFSILMASTDGCVEL